MKHLKLFFALFAMLALNVGNALGAETLYKNALFKSANCTSNSSYTGKVTCTIGTDSWVAQNAANNNGVWDYVKIGAKKSKSSDPTKVTTGTITTNAAYAEAVSKIVVNGKKDRGSFTSKLIIASNSSFTTDKVEITGATSFTNNQIVFEIASPSANKYYKLEFVCSNTTTSNGVIQVSSVEYYYEPSSEETVVSVPTFSVPEGTFYSPINVELSCSTADAEIHYTLDGSTPTSTSEKYTTAIAVSETTTVKAIAVKDGLTNSEVATATYTKGETVTSYDIDFETNALEAYVNWNFSNITITTTTIEAKAGTYYANTSGKASASIKTKEKIQYPGILTFSVSKESTNTTASNWLVQVSENGTTWSTVGTISATEMTKGNWKDHSVDLSDYENVYVQISYGSSTAVRAIDEISLAQGVAPVKYTLTIENPENGTLSVTNGGASVASGDQFKAGTSLVVTPTPAIGYVFESLTVGGSEVELSEGKYTFTMPENDVTISATFKANEKPAATLTLSKNGVTEDITGYKQDDKVILPSITSDCVKEFVGWSADANCATEPEYAPGASYTLASTSQTLYAVYATVEGGEATASVDMATYANDNSWGSSSSTNQKEININSDLKAVISEGANSGKYYNDGVRIYQTEDATVTVSTTAGELKSVKFTFTIANNGTLLHEGVAMTSDEAVEVSGNSAVFTVGDTHATDNKGQVRFTAIEVVYTGGATYSNYSTTCSAALANPTFSLTEGKYTEAKSVEITATEGTVYYTTDGTTPTASSNQYTGAIALNDCGEYTIKAVAISADSQSDVVSATYTIKLPLTNSQAAPYTEAEAIAAYDGGCYDNQDVYVKGTVKSATFSSTYGNYTITLTNGFQFYRFLQAAETKFTEDIIVPGDVLIACGKLSKYQTTYQLAEGCYLVERIPYEGEKTDISNTETTAYTVDQAFALIADVSSDLTKEVYVKGIVAVAPTSNPTDAGKMTYSISDNGANTGNVLKVYLGLGLEGAAFTSKDDVKQGDYVVAKGKLLDYSGTYELTDNQLVQHKKAATITIADITMEVGETKTIAATITPAAAETAVVYTIKENTANAISLSGNTITATAVGTATITATIATAAEYMGKTVDFTVTVGPKTESEEVVILAEYNGQWYALKAETGSSTNSLAALEVEYFNGVLYNVDEADTASITWKRTIVGNFETFQYGDKYLKGSSSTNLFMEDGTGGKCQWDKDTHTMLIGSTNRTFLYQGTYFKNYAISNAGRTVDGTTYSALPVVTAPVYATGNPVYTREGLTNGKFGTICLPYASASTSGATFFEIAYQETGKVYIDEVTALEAGVPYIFLAKSATLTVTCEGTPAGEASSKNGLYGTFTEIADVAAVHTDEDEYILTDGLIRKCESNCKVPANRAYIVLDEISTEPTPAPVNRRRISMSVHGENGTTGLDNIMTTDAPAKVIVNGQLIIIRGGVKYNVQGQKL